MPAPDKMRSFQQRVSQAAESRAGVLFMGPEGRGPQWVEPPQGGRVLMLAPHPDDGEAVAVTLRMFAGAGCEVLYKIACLSPSGVTDEFALARAADQGLEIAAGDLARFKKELRRAEQLDSEALGGFVSGEPEFLGLEEDTRGSLADSPANALAFAAMLADASPDVAVMPAGEDTNIDHVLVCRWFRRAAAELAASQGRPVLGLYNRDPKTVRIHEQLAVPFDEQDARWKAGLLAAHRSQHERNLAQRGHGLDERILKVNRPAWERVKGSLPPEITPLYACAEVFQVELFR